MRHDRRRKPDEQQVPVIFELNIPQGPFGPEGRPGDPWVAVNSYGNALEELDRPDGSDFERLESACIRLVGLPKRDLPRDLLAEHVAILSALTCEPAAGEGSVRATINAMTSDVASDLIRRIRALAGTLFERKEQGRRRD
jgi:hypothetical protein